MMNKIYAACYDTLYVFNNKEQAKKFFGTCYYSSEGAEKERYASILADLNFSNTGKDNISKYITNITIKVNDEEEKFLSEKLDNDLSIDDSIDFYNKKINPILEISNKYGVDFNRKIPFEEYGSDEDSYVMFSFSDYYRELLEKYNINCDSINTSDVSAGKYEMKINDDLIIDIRAWDNLNSVLDNVDTVLEYSKKEELER